MARELRRMAARRRRRVSTEQEREVEEVLRVRWVEGRREVRSLRARSLYAMRVGRPTLSTAQVCTSPRARSC